MRAFLNDTFILRCDAELRALAGKDLHRLRARDAFWSLYDHKWAEFVKGERFPDDLVNVFHQVQIPNPQPYPLIPTPL
jgi:hypothetical protein